MAGVVIVDDAEDLRRLLVLAITRDGRLDVLADVGDGRQAVETVRRLVPDVVLMDISMPVMDGLSATREIKAAHPSMPVMLFTGYADDRLAAEGRASGADGFLDKATPLREVVDALVGLVATAGSASRSELPPSST